MAGKTVCICGAGNAAHVFIPWFIENGYEVTVFADFGDEAARLRAASEENGGILLHDRRDPSNIREYKHKATVISNNAADAVPQADYIIIALPSFAIGNVLRGIKEHLKPGAIMYVMPGQGGPNLVTKTIMGDELKANKYTLAGVMPMPLNCRIEEFGKKVQLAAFKAIYHVATVPAKNATVAAEGLSKLLGKPVIPVGSYTAIALMGANGNLHPARIYGLWGPDSQMGLYEEGKTYKENPLFYETWDDKSAEWCQKISDERLAIWRAICEKFPEVGKPDDVPAIKQQMSNIYAGQIADDSTLAKVFNTNDGFKGFKCPMKQQKENEWVPDFANRYFTEDFPETVAMYKGIADLAGVQTPVLDEITLFFQKFMGKEYIKDGKLSGADVPHTKSPQAYGITSLEQLLAD